MLREIYFLNLRKQYRENQFLVRRFIVSFVIPNGNIFDDLLHFYFIQKCNSVKTLRDII